MLLTHEMDEAFTRRFTSFFVALVRAAEYSVFIQADIIGYLKRLFFIHGTESLLDEAMRGTVTFDEALAFEANTKNRVNPLLFPADRTVGWAALWRLTEEATWLFLPTSSAFYGAQFLARHLLRKAEGENEKLDKQIQKLFTEELCTAEELWRQSGERPQKDSKRRAELRNHALRVEVRMCHRPHCPFKTFTHAHFQIPMFPAWWQLYPHHLESAVFTQHSLTHMLEKFFSEKKGDETVWTINEKYHQDIGGYMNHLPLTRRTKSTLG